VPIKLNNYPFNLFRPELERGMGRRKGKEEWRGKGGKDASVKTVHPLALNNLVKGAKYSG